LGIFSSRGGCSGCRKDNAGMDVFNRTGSASQVSELIIRDR
jgi:hypothetical protein